MYIILLGYVYIEKFKENILIIQENIQWEFQQSWTNMSTKIIGHTQLWPKANNISTMRDLCT